MQIAKLGRITFRAKSDPTQHQDDSTISVLKINLRGGQLYEAIPVLGSNRHHTILAYDGIKSYTSAPDSSAIAARSDGPPRTMGER